MKKSRFIHYYFQMVTCFFDWCHVTDSGQEGSLVPGRLGHCGQYGGKRGAVQAYPFDCAKMGGQVDQNTAQRNVSLAL